MSPSLATRERAAERRGRTLGLREGGFPVRKIADLLGVSHSQIIRDLRAGPDIRLGHGAKARRPEAERFWAKVDRTGSCWLWEGARQRSKSGEYYGHFRTDDHHTLLTHRWAYEHGVGPIPKGLVIDHLCETTLCVRAEHLEPVTQRVNYLRGHGKWAKGRTEHERK